METEKSVTQCLADAGYRHERTEFSTTNGRHRIIDAATGRAIGLMTAHEACEFLASLRTTAA